MEKVVKNTPGLVVRRSRLISKATEEDCSSIGTVDADYMDEIKELKLMLDNEIADMFEADKTAEIDSCELTEEIEELKILLALEVADLVPCNDDIQTVEELKIEIALEIAQMTTQTRMSDIEELKTLLCIEIQDFLTQLGPTAETANADGEFSGEAHEIFDCLCERTIEKFVVEIFRELAGDFGIKMEETGILDLTDDEEGFLEVEEEEKEEFLTKEQLVWRNLSTKADFAFMSHEIPKELERLFENQLVEFDGMTDMEREALATLQTLMETGLTPQNYRNYFAVAIYAIFFEEAKEVAQWKINKIKMYTHRNGNAHFMQIPGIVDGAPTVRKGDTVVISYKTAFYKMSVKKVIENDVYLEIIDRAHRNVFKKCKSRVEVGVEFLVNDHVFCLVHKVLKSLSDQLMMSGFPFRPPARIPNDKWKKKNVDLFNKSVCNNPQQFQAVSLGFPVIFQIKKIRPFAFEKIITQFFRI